MPPVQFRCPECGAMEEAPATMPESMMHCDDCSDRMVMMHPTVTLASRPKVAEFLEALHAGGTTNME